MKFLDRVQDKITGALVGYGVGGNALSLTAVAAEEAAIRESSGISRSSEALSSRLEQVMESSLAEIELSFDDQGWRGMNGAGLWNFQRATLRKMAALARIMYLINPLIKRAVTVQELYVWGRGVKIKAKSKDVNKVLDDFFKDPKNQAVIGDSWTERERDQRIDGNSFFCFFRNRVNGRARVRVMPFDRVEDIVCNPEDAKETYFYLILPATGDSGTRSGEPVYYPDINYTPKVRPSTHTDGKPIDWDVQILHLKTGGLSTMKFGVPELLSVLNWATAYKKILENFATTIAAYARLAMQIVGLRGKDGVAAAKSKLNTGMTSGKKLDGNPPPNTASWALMSGGTEIKPIKTAGSTTGPDESRALRSMVAAGSDTPEHFFGDSDVGNFATSSTLDRPTELKMIARQDMWAGVILRVCNLLIEWSAVAPQGVLRSAGYKASRSINMFDKSWDVIITPPADQSIAVEVKFPNILERDVTDRVRSVVQAITLGGSPAEGIIPDRREACRLLMEALGMENYDELVDLLYSGSVIQGFIDPADRADDEHLTAQGRKELGDAALIAAKQPKTPKAPPSGSPASGGSRSS